MYRFSLTINDFLSSGSVTIVNLTFIKSFALNGFCDTGHKIVESGFSTFDLLADGACDGTQKLGRVFSLPLAMLDIADVLVLGLSPKII